MWLRIIPFFIPNYGVIFITFFRQETHGGKGRLAYMVTVARGRLPFTIRKPFWELYNSYR
jgi:hypothetical protein